jgi:hypothetical protein
MSWLKVDDQFTDHPKVLALGKDRLAGIGLWVIGSCYAGRFLTDGYIPATALPSGSRRLAHRLVDVGLWDHASDGYRIHDYLDYQPGRAAVLRERQRNAARQAKYRGGVTSSGSNGVTHGVSNDAPARPVPDPLSPEPPNPHGADDLEVLADGLLGHPATPGQLRAIRTLDRKVGRDRTLEVMRSSLTSDVDDRFGEALDTLGSEATAKRKPNEFAYMDAES